MIKLDGKALSLEWRDGLKPQVEEFTQKYGKTPTLAVVLVGDNPASHVYVKNKIKACESVGIRSLEKTLSAEASETDVISIVESLNQDSSVHGILVQLPLPNHIVEKNVIDKIHPLKDADGLGIENMGLLLAGRKRVAPCTPFGVIQLLKKHGIPMEGKKALVIGRSQIVGKPMGLLLLEENATVTFCHSKTENLRSFVKDADIVVVAAGRPEFLGKEDFDRKSVVVDVGIHRKESGKLCGDVRYDEIKDLVHAASPVPGGVGPMTIAMLLENTLKLANLQCERG
ncbi:MAG: bifunctional methylenetetrahydrofolate dehydrogenase/methenyltetrahydrofolate cyclohydrolase FolD [Pseudomonadota bacterium]